jgi:hypothetical protein
MNIKAACFKFYFILFKILTTVGFEFFNTKNHLSPIFLRKFNFKKFLLFENQN